MTRARDHHADRRGPTILPTFPNRWQRSSSILRRLGVESWENLPHRRRPDLVQLDGQAIAASTILWAAGVAASPLGSWLGVPLDRAGRVIVEPDLSIPGRPDVFVVGDLAAFTHQDGKALPGLAPVAQQQGRHAALNIVRLIAHQQTQPFRYRDYGNMATIGRGAAIADFGRVRLSGFIGWLAWLFVHIMRLVGFRNRIAVFFQWAWAYVSYQRSVRLITGINPRMDDW